MSKPIKISGPFLEYNKIVSVVKLGDLIEIKRKEICHWVICRDIDSNGRIWCVHVTDSHGKKIKGTSQVQYQLLEHILKDTDDGQPSLCRVNNQEDMALEVLAEHNMQPPDLNKVFESLDQMKGKIVEYDLGSSNCEHYCTLWKYGIGWSSQVNTFGQKMEKLGYGIATGVGMVAGGIMAFIPFANLLAIGGLELVVVLVGSYALTSVKPLYLRQIKFVKTS